MFLDDESQPLRRRDSGLADQLCGFREIAFALVFLELRFDQRWAYWHEDDTDKTIDIGGSSRMMASNSHALAWGKPTCRGVVP